MQLIRTILILLLIFYGFRLLTRYVFPFLLKRWVNKKVGQFQQGGFQEHQKSYSDKNEGEVRIKGAPKRKKSETDGVGDYVDFEEVE